MCGRYSLTSPPTDLDQLPVRILGELQPNNNIAPASTIAIGRLWNHSELVIGPARWGLVPYWAPARDDGKPDFPLLFNARSESVATKPSFREAYAHPSVTGEAADDTVKHGRCVVPMTSWYEWTDAAPGMSSDERLQELSGGRKQPYAFSRTDRTVFYCAGLFAVWSGVVTATILTTKACPELEWAHDRMPVVLPDDAAVVAWLATSEPPVSDPEIGNKIKYIATSI